MEMLRGSFGAERASVKLYRISNGAEEFCSEYQPEEFEKIGLDGVRQQWGHGTYTIRLYATHPETNKFVRRASQTIKIAEPLRALITAPQQNNSELANVFEAIQKNQEMMLRALTERPPAPDPMAEMTKMLAMMSAMREAMGLNQQQQQPQKSSIGEIVDAIKELRGASSLLEGKEEKEESLMGMLPQVLDVIKTGMSQQTTPQAPQQMPVVHLPQSIATAETVQQPQETEDMINPMAIARLMKDKASIEKMIAEKTPSLDAANWIVEHASDELVSVLVTDEWFDGLVSVMPAAKEHEVWLKETREHTMKMLKDDGFFGEPEVVASPE
jgi:hypothetical protein